MKYISEIDKAKAIRPTPFAAAAMLALPPWLYLLKRYMCIHTHRAMLGAITNYRAQQWGSNSEQSRRWT